MQLALIRKNPDDFLSLYNEKSRKYDPFLTISVAYYNFKAFIMEDIPKNIKYLDLCKNILGVLDIDGEEFNQPERNAICNEIIRQNIVVSKDSYEWIVCNQDVVLNSILHSKTPSQINQLTPFAVESVQDYYGELLDREDLLENFAESLREMHYIYNENISPDFFIEIPEISLALIENNPYLIENYPDYYRNPMYYLNSEEEKKLIEILKKSNYVFSRKTPEYIINLSPEFLLSSYEMFFDEYDKIPALHQPNDMTDAEFDFWEMRQCEIVKEHDPNLVTYDEMFTNNKYIHHEAVSKGIVKGIIPSERRSEFIERYNLKQDRIRKLQQTGQTVDFDENFVISNSMTRDEISELYYESKEVIFQSVCNNIYSLLHTEYYTDSNEELEKIAKIYLEDYPNTLKNMLSVNIDLPYTISSNPYIQYELLYKNPNRRIDIDPIVNGPFFYTPEIENEVYTSFFKENYCLTPSSTKYEASNLKIALKSIENNPMSFKYVSKEISFYSEIEDLIIKLIREGKYVIDENTPEKFILLNISSLYDCDNVGLKKFFYKKPEKIPDIIDIKVSDYLLEQLIYDFEHKNITTEDFLKILKQFNGYNLIDVENLSKVETILIENPQLIENVYAKDFSVLEIYLSKNLVQKIIACEQGEDNSTFKYRLSFQTPKKLINHDEFSDIIYFKRVELIPLLSDQPYKIDVLERSRQVLFSKIRDHSLNLPEFLPIDYHFSSKFFENISEQEFSGLIDEVVFENPYYISMFSSSSDEQDRILKEKLDKLIEDGKISYDSNAFNLPNFKNNNFKFDYVIAMLKEDPTRINNLKFKLPERNEEEIKFVINVIKENLIENGNISEDVFLNTQYIKNFLEKGMSYLSNLSIYNLNKIITILDQYFSTKNGLKLEDVPENLQFYYIQSGYFEYYRIQEEISRLEVQATTDDNTYLNVDKYEIYRKNPHFINNRIIISQMVAEGYRLKEDDPIGFQINFELIKSTITQDPSYIYKIHPLAICVVYNDNVDKIVDILIEKNFQIKDKLPIFLNHNLKLLDYALKQDKNNIDFFDIDKLISEDSGYIIYPINLINILIENNIFLSAKSHPKLCDSHYYIMGCLEKAEKPEEIKEIINNARIDNFSRGDKNSFFVKVLDLMKNGKYIFDKESNPNLDDSNDIVQQAMEQNIRNILAINPNVSSYSYELHNTIYEYYLKHKEELEQDEDFRILLSKNPYYIMDMALSDIEHFDNDSFRGISVTSGFIEAISEKLISSDYRITEQTPHFLLLNSEFLQRYIYKYQTVDGIPPIFVAKLFTLENLDKNPEIAYLYEYCTDINTELTCFVNFWGVDLTIELVQRFGSLITYLDPTQEYTLESAQKYLNDYLDNNKISDIKQIILFYQKLDREVTEDDFENNYELSNNDEFILYAYSQGVNSLLYYQGQSEGILLLAEDIDDLDVLDRILKKDNFAKSTALIRTLIENKGPEYIFYFKENYESNISKELVRLAIDKGLLKDKDEKSINSFLDKSPKLRSSDLIMLYLIEHFSPNYIEKYTGNSEEVFEKAIECGLLNDKNESEINDILSKNPSYKGSDQIIIYLIKKYSPEYINLYTGHSTEVCNIALENGLFKDKDKEYINNILEQKEWLKTEASVIIYLIENISADYIEQYKGNKEYVYSKAIEKGYEVTFEKMVRFAFYSSNQMIEAGIKKDPRCHAFKYSKYDDTKKLEILIEIIGKEAYETIFDDKNNNNEDIPSKEDRFLRLTELVKGKIERYEINNINKSKTNQNTWF